MLPRCQTCLARALPLAAQVSLPLSLPPPSHSLCFCHFLCVTGASEKEHEVNPKPKQERRYMRANRKANSLSQWDDNLPYPQGSMPNRALQRLEER